MNINFKVTGLTRLGIKRESTTPEEDSASTQPSELLLKKQLLFPRVLAKKRKCVRFDRFGKRTQTSRTDNDVLNHNADRSVADNASW